MSNYEYKTVALSRSISKRRRRKQSDADLVAEQLGTVLNEEAVDGWEYMRAETLTTPPREGWFSKEQEITYAVLIFRRVREVAWRRDETPAAISRATHSETPIPAPLEPEVAKTTDTISNTSPDIRIASTSGQIVTRTEPTIGDGGSVTPLHSRPPLGSAQD